MGTVINGSKINNFYIAGNNINGFAKNGEIVFKKEIYQELEIIITKSPDTITSGNVTVTLTANKNITLQNAGTWIKINDYTYRKVYPSNTTQTFTVVAEGGETKEVTIVIDNIDKAPTITIKTGENETVGNETDGYSKISFKIFDDKALEEYQLNDTISKVSASQWGDINNITTSTKGAVLGNNILTVRDSVGNETSIEFKLIEV